MVILLVNLLVKMHVVKSHALWCTNICPVYVYSSPVVWVGSEYLILIKN